MLILLFLLAFMAPHQVSGYFVASPSPDVVQYRVYKGNGECPVMNINYRAITETSFVDTKVKSQRTYSYQVTAVNGDGLESVPSNCVVVTVPR